MAPIDNLWSPWRSEYVTGTQPDGCPLCANQDRPDADAYIVHRGEHAILARHVMRARRHGTKRRPPQDKLRPADAQQTDVVSLNADLLEVATEQDSHWASVRFSGMVRETPGTQPVGFEEVWNLVKPADGSSGWLLAGIQQMH